MATTIKSTDLDFDAIRNKLKTYLASQEEFSDYNFEGSALSNILDVLAYNTHHNALVANFALNESFLSTAQLRSSLVALAGGLGYQVNSRFASFGVVNLYVFDDSVNKPASVTLPAGFSFTAKVDNVTYTFKTRDTLIGYNDNDYYYFQLNGNKNIAIYEGTTKSKTFIAGPSNENDTYVIPVTNLDLETVSVRVYEDPASTNYDLYTNISNASTIDQNSKIYVIKESPNGYYELNFGSGVRLGKTPAVGSKIQVIYDTVVGPEANGAKTFTPVSTLGSYTVNVTPVAISTGGTYKEEIDSIRKNAPYQYAAQNRMVTAEDYSALIYRKYASVLQDIKTWGGEDNVPPQYGTVFVSLNFADGTNSVIQENTKAGIRSLVKDFSVVSFGVEFTDPIETFLELSVRFQFNPNLTSSSQTEVEQRVRTAISNYFTENLGQFDQSFRRSNLLTLIDDVDDSILSSRADVRMQSRFVPDSGAIDYTIFFPAAIAPPDDVNYSINSSIFNLNGKTCTLRNRLNTNIIEIIDNATGTPLIDNAGYYDQPNGVLYLNLFAGSIISGGYIRITAVPQNQSVINPLRSNILKYDESASFAVAVLTDTL